MTRAFLLVCVFTLSVLGADVRTSLQMFLDREASSLKSLYTEFHQNPELSLLEEQTSARLAKQLREAGFEVTEHVGSHGVVAVLRNGSGPTLLLRSDLDALPVKEETGLPYASKRLQKNLNGEEVPVMH